MPAAREDRIEDPQARPTVVMAPDPPAQRRRGFPIPGLLKSLFDRFPLVIYPPNGHPGRASRPKEVATLYIFCRPEDERRGNPSFNPACLKWQTYLRFNDIPFATVSSNNHASPSGALPFLIPPQTPGTSVEASLPVASSQLEKWVREQVPRAIDVVDPRYDAYLSLLGHCIRNAWVCSLYLDPGNASIMERLYIDPCSSNPLVRATLASQLRTAAHEELLKSLTRIDVTGLYCEAEDAFAALSVLLGDHAWFFDAEGPSLFDASVFAYTHLLLDDSLGWKESKLQEAVRKRENLVRHRDSITSKYYGLRR